jgi:hypothetical protein
MVNTTDNRTLPKTGAETEFDRGVGATPYKTMPKQSYDQDNQSIWIFVAIGLAILAGGLYYYMNSSPPAVVTPEITQTTPPPVTTTPKVEAPPAATPDPVVETPPAATPDPLIVPKTNP